MSKTWNSINPATLSGAIDVIVVEQEDGEARKRLGYAHVLNLGRIACLFALSRTLRKVLLIAAIRKEGKLDWSSCFILCPYYSLR